MTFKRKRKFDKEEKEEHMRFALFYVWLHKDIHITNDSSYKLDKISHERVQS